MNGVRAYGIGGTITCGLAAMKTAGIALVHKKLNQMSNFDTAALVSPYIDACSYDLRFVLPSQTILSRSIDR